MKYSIIAKMRSYIILCLIWLVGAFTPKPKLCINCKYFITDSKFGYEYGKCSAFPVENTKILIDGVVRMNEFRFCYTARSCDDLCGKIGKKYYKSRRKQDKI